MGPRDYQRGSVLRAAVGAEFLVGFQGRAAASAISFLRLRGGVRCAAVGAKLLADRQLSLAAGALHQRGAAEEIYVFGIFLSGGFGIALLAGGQDLLRPQLLLFVGSTFFAGACARVPAHVGARLMAVARALLEVVLALGHGRFQGRVVGLATDTLMW